MRYFYNPSGIFGAVIKGVLYYYVKDFRGDILEIRKASDNSKVASYVYDAWGNTWVFDEKGEVNSDPNFIGNFNPFRYRGYYYDTDLKMYYLITRWYNPEIGRFINLDQISYLDPETINGLNLYAYCLNNPVMGYDPTGTLEWWHKILIGLGVIVLGAAVTALTAGTGTGFVATFGSALVSSLIQTGVSTALSVGIGMIYDGIKTQSWEGVVDGLKENLVNGFMWGGIFSGGAQILSGGFKLYATIANKYNFLSTAKKSPIFSPDRLKGSEEISKIAGKGQSFYDYGGTLIRFGSVAHIDVSTKSFLHLAAFGYNHIPLGTFLAGILGGIL